MDVSETRSSKRPKGPLATLVATTLALGVFPLAGPDVAVANERAAFWTSFEATEPVPGPDSDVVTSDGVSSSAGAGMSTVLAGGPTESWTSADNVGFRGVASLHYSGDHSGTGAAHSVNQLFDVDIPVSTDTRLSYKIFPALMTDDLELGLPSPSSYVAVDLQFDDGTMLSDLGAVDAYGLGMDAASQGDSKVLFADFWNDVSSEIGDVAAGKTITGILLEYNNPSAEAGAFEGWLDDIEITHEPLVAPEHLADWVSTTRGTDSNRDFSRGNTFPATAWPHGFNLWTPVTDAGTNAFLYQYRERNNERNLTELQALSLSHQGYPWGGERHTWQVMPVAGDQPIIDRSERALEFSHDDEVDKPYLYSVTGTNGLTAELTPTNRAALMRFTFPGDTGTLVFDNINDRGSINVDIEAGEVSGYTMTGESRDYPKFFYATFDAPLVSGGKITDSERPNVTAYAGFDTSSGDAVTMRVGTSFISVDQARHNADLEIPAGSTFDDIQTQARDAWNEQLSVLSDIEGASHDQMVGLYSDIYRMSLYPHTIFENRGTADAPDFAHASIWGEPAGPNTESQTGASILEGKAYRPTNFWDTYRTAWPAHVLLYPEQAGEMLDGALTQYRELGWLATTMVGTNSDVTIADAYVKGVRNFNSEDAYSALLRNAMVAPPRGDWVGRAGLHEAQFLGYTPVSTREGFAESMENYLNDFGISRFAAQLAEEAEPGSAEEEMYLTHAEYFENRAQNYVNLFDQEAGFFQGRRTNGEFRVPAAEYDPRDWGGDYTETNGWGMAFSVPHDGQGLANLYGGTDALEAKLDEFFATPETAKFPGGYGNVIHEMVEAAYVQLGQWGLSNQPAHHISYMYNYVGAPHKAQALNREALTRAFTGNQIGQGYPGDEDTGEMSMWYLFGAAGFYPLQVGTDAYVIGSPMFTSMTLNLESGNSIVIEAPNNSRENVYVQSLLVNGQPWTSTSIPHDVLAAGATLTFDMGPEPSSWGTAEDDLPDSLTEGAEAPNPLQDLTGTAYGTPTSSEGAAEALFDNTSVTEKAFTGTEAEAMFSFAGGTQRQVEFYTLTSGAAAGDPTEWALQGSNDGESWTTLDERSGEAFTYRTNTKVYRVQEPGMFAHYRVVLNGSAGFSLAEIELLGYDNEDHTMVVGLSPTLSLALPDQAAQRTFTLSVADTVTAESSYDVEITGPEGWTITPSEGQITLSPAGSQPNSSGELQFEVEVPAGTPEGDYAISAVVYPPDATPLRVASTITVTDEITFRPATGDEELWLYRDDNSQVDGVGNRFTDGGSSVTYRFPLPPEADTALARIEVDNQFLVEVSPDGETWTEVLREEQEVRDGSNWGAHEADLAEFLGDDGVVYVRVSDSFPNDGWGARLNRMTVTMAQQTIPNPIEFDTGTADETRWLEESNGSVIGDVGQRYVDEQASFTYLFPFPEGTHTATATVTIDNQYLVEISNDGETWIEVLREEREIRDGSNYGPQTFDMSPALGDDGVVYMRVSDSYPNDGWGARLTHVLIEWDNSTRDTTAPVVTAEVSDDGVLSATAEDDVELASIEYRVDGGDWLTYVEAVEMPVDARVVELRATDAAGNVSEIVVVDIPDRLAPEVTADLSEDNVLSAEATDDHSGLGSIEYRVDGGDWMLFEEPTALPEGAQTVEVRATDNAGNVSEIISLATADRVPPTVEVEVSDTGEVTVTVQDDRDGAIQVEYRVDGGEWIVYDGSVTLPLEGQTVEVRATDSAGNTSEMVSVTVPDELAPELVASVSDSGILSASATDNGSGVASIEYRLDGEGEWLTYAGPTQLPAGVASVEVRATDEDGNVSDVLVVEVPGVEEPEPTPDPTPEPTPDPTPEPTPDPTPTDDPTSRPSPTDDPSTDPSAGPTTSPTPPGGGGTKPRPGLPKTGS